MAHPKKTEIRHLNPVIPDRTQWCWKERRWRERRWRESDRRRNCDCRHTTHVWCRLVNVNNDGIVRSENERMWDAEIIGSGAAGSCWASRIQAITWLDEIFFEDPPRNSLFFFSNPPFSFLLLLCQCQIFAAMKEKERPKEANSHPSPLIKNSANARTQR